MIAIETSEISVRGSEEREFWEGLLGLDYDRAIADIDDDEALVHRIARLGPGPLKSLLALAGLASGDAGDDPKAMAGRLLATARGRRVARQTALTAAYLAGRRLEGLREAVEALAAEGFPRPEPRSDAREAALVQALWVIESRPEFMIYYDLYDRAARVSYREWRLAGGSGGGIAGLAGAVEKLDRAAVERALALVEPGGECLAAASSGGPAHRDFFVLLPGPVQIVRTVDGLRRLRRGRWLILRFREGGKTLSIHGPEDLGARVAEAAVGRASGGGDVRYARYLPEADTAAVARFLDELRRGPGPQARLEAVALNLARETGIEWRVEGEAGRGLALLAGLAGGLDGAELHEATLAFLREGASGGAGGQGSSYARFKLVFAAGENESTRRVAYRAVSSDEPTRRAFVEWMEGRGIPCAPF